MPAAATGRCTLKTVLVLHDGIDKAIFRSTNATPRNSCSEWMVGHSENAPSSGNHSGEGLVPNRKRGVCPRENWLGLRSLRLGA